MKPSLATSIVVVLLFACGVWGCGHPQDPPDRRGTSTNATDSEDAPTHDGGGPAPEALVKRSGQDGADATKLGRSGEKASSSSATHRQATAKGKKKEAKKGPKRWTGISMMNRKEALEGVDPALRCQALHVYRGSPAFKAGVKKGDLLVAVDDHPIHRFQDVSKALKGRPIGYTFRLKVYRAGRTLEMPVTIEEKPKDMRAWQKRVFTGAPATPFEVEALNGKLKGQHISSEDYDGRILVLDFWATWCGPCRKAMPALERLEKTYGSQGLTVIGITSENPKVVALFLEKHPLSYLVAHDRYGDVKRDYEISKLPTLYVVDRRGVIRYVGIGSGHMKDIEKTIQSLL